MKQVRKNYSSDGSDEEWALCAPYLTLMKEAAPQREYPLRELYNGLRWFVRAGCFKTMAGDLRALLRLARQRDSVPTAVILDSRTLQSTPESGGQAGYDGAKKRKGSKVHAAVDTLGHLLALKVTAATEQDRAQVGELTQAVQAATGANVELADVDQGYTGGATGGSRSAARIEIGSGETSRSQAGLCIVAAPLGGGAFVCLGGALPQTRPRLRTFGHHAVRLPLARLRHAYA